MTGPTIRFDSPSHPEWRCYADSPGERVVCDASGSSAALHRGGEVIRRWSNPLDAFDWMAESLAAEGHGGRWAGYISYDLGRLVESIPGLARDDLGLPMFAFARVGRGPLPDHLPLALPPPTPPSTAYASCSRGKYEALVGRVLDYISAGDVYQVNLSQRFAVAIPPATGSSIYARLRARFPAEYGAMLDFGDFQIISNSPELFFKISPDSGGGRLIINRPIKGTRPRGAGMYDELLRSEKDAAELAMIVDLQRNDLGRVCLTGSVRVTEPRIIEAHPTIYHGVATVEGLLRPETRLSDILRALFPCGSVTGCPKIRAMQIIEELEPVRRGPYCGAIGYLDADGSSQFNVAIRTITVKNNVAYIPVGGGIVADSRPAEEYGETIVKSRAMLSALGATLRE